MIDSPHVCYVGRYLTPAKVIDPWEKTANCKKCKGNGALECPNCKVCHRCPAV